MNVKLDVSRWRWLYGSSPKLTPSSGGFSFNFPKKSGSVHYLQTSHGKVIPFGGTMRVRGSIVMSDDCKMWSADNNDVLPCHFSLMIRKGSELYSSNGRFWKRVGEIKQGNYDVIIPIEGWTNVDGKYDKSAFKKILNNHTDLGITFGGSYFAGHGVGVENGSASWSILGWEIN